jgi:isoleucyl-tRNA synthetase
MSKSLGNTADPVDVAAKHGAEIVRMWVASVDFREDVNAAPEVIERIAENYKKIRNSLFRYILGNLGGFDPAHDAVKFADMLRLDQYMLVQTAEVAERVRAWYEGFEFHRIYHQLNEFCTTDLSAVYFDVIKDRLYTSAPRSPARRSAQTALWKIGEALVRLLAPVMTFTTDEVWQHLPQVPGRPESVHLAYFPKGDDLTDGPVPADLARALNADFGELMKVREEVNKALESRRADKFIGSGLEAVVTLNAPAGMQKLLEAYRSDLRYLFIVSGVDIKYASDGNGSTPLRVDVEKAPGTKCDRCWNYSTHVGESRRYPTVCERCLAALGEIEKDLVSR